MSDRIVGQMTANWSEACGLRAKNEHDLCRLLVEAGHSASTVTLLDAVTGKPRVEIPSVANAAVRCVRETGKQGPRFVKWAPMPDGVFATPNAGDDQ